MNLTPKEVLENIVSFEEKKETEISNLKEKLFLELKDFEKSLEKNYENEIKNYKKILEDALLKEIEEYKKEIEKEFQQKLKNFLEKTKEFGNKTDLFIKNLKEKILLWQ